MRIVLLSLLCLALGACAASVDSKINFNPSEPLRVAVLPFRQIDSKGELVKGDADILLDNVALVSDKLGSTPAELVRNAVQAELSKSSLDVLSPAEVDSRLSHSGFALDTTALNLAMINAASPKDICTRVLDCDAVLYGTITKWDRSYYAIQSVASVGVELKLVSAKDGSLLFESRAEDSESRGLTKGPTGFSDLVLEPIKGLNNNIIVNLSRDVVRKAIAPLTEKNRPEFLETPPPAIFASAHDARNDAVRETMTVVLLGSANQTASFSLGEELRNYPMTEKEGGHYIGELHLLPTDCFKPEPVTVSLTDSFGRTTIQHVGKSAVRACAG